MALFTEDRLRARVRSQYVAGGFFNETISQKAERILTESSNRQKNFSETREYDIFLSHSSKDAQLVAGLKLELEDLGYLVYVDWIEDPKLNRTSVTKGTALMLQQRMKQSKSLIYAFSENAVNSKWMPWELGYFDALKGTVAVLPISTTNQDDFRGSEYLGIYYYIKIANTAGTNIPTIWVHETASKYMNFNSWLKGNLPMQR
ncbi:toll/interleukin-1 receptor domain-containing protein [Chitinophaga lutea]